jgi:glycine betaine/proline transport system ATP-binding protein
LNKTIIFITHDFDEALRLADRIAIMKDGRIEQCDTPDQIVLHPATDYVAKFTAEIDRARVVHIGSLAQPMTEPVSGDAVLASRTIRELARQLISDTRSLIPVAGADGAIIGVARRQDALDVLLGDGH